MNVSELLFMPCELKFVGDENQPGVFEGYGSVFGNQDWHGDVVEPGAFDATLAKHKSEGTMPAMFAQHSAFVGGDMLPIGKWLSIEPDAHGLKVRGKLSALDTDHGRRLRSLMQDAALPGLSIAFSVPKDGAVIGKKAGEPKRLLKQVDLIAIDVVHAPSNGAALIQSMKAMMRNVDHTGAVAAVASAIQLHRDTMSGSDAPTAAERGQMMSHLQDAHQCLTGEPMPSGMKARPNTIRELETRLRDEFGFSRSEARALVEHGFKPAKDPRDEEDAAVIAEAKAKADAQAVTDADLKAKAQADAEAAAKSATQSIEDIRRSVAGFSLPKLK